MKVQLIAAGLLAGFMTTAGATQNPEVHFDVFYKVRGDIVEQASARLVPGSSARVLLANGMGVDVATWPRETDGDVRYFVELDAPNSGHVKSRHNQVLRADLTQHQPSFTYHLKDGRSVVVIVRSPELLKGPRKSQSQ
jgi:hypothetical protein